jgi:hypothetical protein
MRHQVTALGARGRPEVSMRGTYRMRQGVHSGCPVVLGTLRIGGETKEALDREHAGGEKRSQGWAY